MQGTSLHLACLLLSLGLAAAGPAANKPFEQDAGPDGLVSIECEHYDNKVDMGTNTWALVTTATTFTGTFSGGEAMQIMPDTPTGGTSRDTDYVTRAAHLDFNINFGKTGTYYVWLLAFGRDGNSDSAHAGLDGLVIDTCDRMSGWNNNYRWRNTTSDGPRATFEVDSTGVHTLNLYMREDGLAFDKVVLTTNPDYTPTGAGPAESPRGTPDWASGPAPADGATDVARDVILSWVPGPSAVAHDVYFGAVRADVDTATRTDAKDVLANQAQAADRYDPTVVLGFSTTYYWRVDEVNTPPGAAVIRGNVWSFTTESRTYRITSITATASSSEANFGPENTVNNSGLSNNLHSTDNTAAWISNKTGPQPTWIQYEFDQLYRLDEMRVWNYNVMFEPIMGFGFKDVTIEYSADGTTWTLLEETQFARAPGQNGYAVGTRVDFDGAVAKFVRLTAKSNWGGIVPQFGLSEVRFYQTPAMPRQPVPASGATNVDENAVLSWRAGREAASHTLYFGTDSNAVAAGTAPVQTLADHQFDPGPLDLGRTYYWKVIEVNDAATPPTWEGALWSFSTREFLIVDNFERYTAEEGRTVYETWRDGSIDQSSGSIVGLWPDPINDTYCETTIVHGGNKSMPLAYDNTMPPYYSEATLTFDTPQNWTAHGLRSLSLWFQGKAGNGGQLYVKINNTKVPYDGSPANLSKAVWLPWNIDLTKVAGNLNQVTKLVIGLEGTGARGTVYIDDVRLYPKAPQYLAPADPGNANLLGLWAFEGNANDTSGHKLNGTLKQAVLVPSGRPGGGSALQVDKAGYVDLGNPPSLDFGAGDWTVSAWFKTTMIGADAGTLYGKGGDDTGGKRYALHMGSSTEGVVSLICDDDKDKCPVDSKSVTNDGQWHCVAAQRAGTELRIYIDGLLEGTLAIPATYDLSGTSQHNAYVGAITNHTDGSLYKLFSGQIDDVRVYNRALTQAEILWLAGQALPAAQPF